MKFLLLVFLLTGRSLLGEEGALRVVATNSLIANLVQEVGGDSVSVTSLIGPDRDLHEFAPTPGDVNRVRQAHIVFFSGLGLEAGFLRKLQDQTPAGPRFESLGEAMIPLTSLADAHDHEDPSQSRVDPHWWQSVANARIAVRVIRDALVAVDPARASQYKVRAASFDRQLEELSRWVRVTVAAVPRNRRILITSHDAFGYFARDYDFTVRPVSGLSPRDKPSSQSVRDLITAIQADSLRTIFLEKTENPKVLTEITRETGAHIGGILYASGLGRTEATTYEDMIRHNVQTIVNALRTPDPEND